MQIPVYILEEHHQAPIAWQHAIENKFIKGIQEILIHVDEHSDMALAHFSKNIYQAERTIEGISKLVYQELHIENFITASIALKMIKDVVWVRPFPVNSLKFETRFLASRNGNGCEFATGIVGPHIEESSKTSDYQEYNYRVMTINDEINSQLEALVDIDYDYFSCNRKPKPLQSKVEITEKAFHDFNRDALHFLRITPGSKVKTLIENDKYYLQFHDYPFSSSGLTNRSADQIVEMIDNLFSFLETKLIKPKCITLSRSHGSGYTPRDQWQLIENELLKRLKGKYEINIIDITELSKQYMQLDAKNDE